MVIVFYTDGTTIWNARTIKWWRKWNWLNGGIGQVHNPQPWFKSKNSSNLYYIFLHSMTLWSTCGFRYSIVDIDFNGGLEQLSKKMWFYAPSDEKLSIVKHANNTIIGLLPMVGIIILFYSYLLTSSVCECYSCIVNAGLVVSGYQIMFGGIEMALDGF
jgi:hypothetical protein